VLFFETVMVKFQLVIHSGKTQAQIAREFSSGPICSPSSDAKSCVFFAVSREMMLIGWSTREGEVQGVSAGSGAKF
jgi:hypothetical protein